MTYLIMILGGCLIGLGIGLMDPGDEKPRKKFKSKNPRKKNRDDFWDYAWS